jgi:hypothetical protein
MKLSSYILLFEVHGLEGMHSGTSMPLQFCIAHMTNMLDQHHCCWQLFRGLFGIAPKAPRLTLAPCHTCGVPKGASVSSAFGSLPRLRLGVHGKSVAAVWTATSLQVRQTGSCLVHCLTSFMPHNFVSDFWVYHSNKIQQAHNTCGQIHINSHTMLIICHNIHNTCWKQPYNMFIIDM